MIDLNHSRNLAVRPRAGCFHGLFLLPVLIAGLGLIGAGLVTAQTFTTLHSFSVTDPNTGTNSDGAGSSDLILSGNTLYGTTQGGGSSEVGTVFAVKTDGTGFTNLHSFSTDVFQPYGGLILSGNTLYGAATYGDASRGLGSGAVFTINTDGTGFRTLHIFTAGLLTYPYVTNSDGAYPFGGLVLTNNTLYGTAYSGGIWGNGTVFKVNTDGTEFTTLHNFTNSSDGAAPRAGLILWDDTLYGTTYLGGSWGNGTVFAINTDGTGFRTLHIFTATSGPDPTNGDGATPRAGLILWGHTLYGTAFWGGTSGNGTVFAINTDGTGFTTLHSFTAVAGLNAFGGFINRDGAQPLAGLVLSGNTLYGTAPANLFKINTDGTVFTNLHTFAQTRTNSLGVYTNSEGVRPNGLVLSDNTLYGTAGWGGDSGNGTVFKVSSDGTGFTNLHSFTPFSTNSSGVFSNSDGTTPIASLILSGHTLYGTAANGGSFGFGTVFKIDTDGSGFTTLYSFSGGSNGAYPQGGLLLSGNSLYGTTSGSGASGDFGDSGSGTVFSLNTNGTEFTTLHSFTATVPYYTNEECGFVSDTNNDGANPSGGLLLSGHTLYGTAVDGGNDSGTLFAVNTDGTGFTTLYRFSAADCVDLIGTVNYDGAYPHELTLSGNTLYGRTVAGGPNGGGSVFRISFSPQLSLIPCAANAILSWPTNYAGFDYTGFTLQSTANFGSSAVWSTNSPASFLVNGQYTVTNLISRTQRFFRLSR